MTNRPGTAPSKGPIIGIRPNRLATSPTMAANLTPRTGQSDEHHDTLGCRAQELCPDV